MRVKCVVIAGPLWMGHGVMKYPDFAIGEEYDVFGIQTNEFGIWYNMLAPGGFLYLVPAALFSIIDGELPGSWRVRSIQGGLWISSQELADGSFLERLSDGDARAQVVLERIIRRDGTPS